MQVSRAIRKVRSLTLRNAGRVIDWSCKIHSRGYRRALTLTAERWLSGRKQRFAKPS